mmetsp:Transcript_19485/g.49543  ORF Transcript_19485/g.49543 Transcript_19485/m.49543 type:complete len:114 (-) Transcript_19485:644-985(-)
MPRSTQRGLERAELTFDPGELAWAAAVAGQQAVWRRGDGLFAAKAFLNFVGGRGTMLTAEARGGVRLLLAQLSAWLVLHLETELHIDAPLVLEPTTSCVVATVSGGDIRGGDA